MSEKRNQKAVDLLKSLDNFDDPVGPAAQLQSERLTHELRKAAAEDTRTKYRLNEDGSEQTAAEILAELEADAAAIAALRKAGG
jgi:hypothetical protein